MIGALLQAATLGLFLAVGAIWPRVKGQSVFSRDLLLNLANGALLYPLRITVVAWLSKVASVGLFSTEGWPDWLKVAVAFLALDFLRYWLHYAHHRVPFLWQFHKVHHMAEQLDASTGLRMHAADFLQLSALPILLFGLLLDTSEWPAWIIIAVMGVGQVMDGFAHANTLLPDGPFFRAWNLLFNSPNFHAWHHTRNGHIIDGNYSNTLIIWDRLFGTDVSHARPPELYGVIEDRTLGNDLLSWWLLRPRLRPQT